MNWLLSHSCECGHQWTQQWSAGVADPRCPKCGKSGGRWEKKSNYMRFSLYITDRLVD